MTAVRTGRWELHSSYAADALYPEARRCGWRRADTDPWCTEPPIYRAQLRDHPDGRRGPALFACQTHGLRLRAVANVTRLWSIGRSTP